MEQHCGGCLFCFTHTHTHHPTIAGKRAVLIEKEPENGVP
jgi:hypothetical protein